MTGSRVLSFALAFGGLAFPSLAGAQSPPPAVDQVPVTFLAPDSWDAQLAHAYPPSCQGDSERSFLQSDRAFPRFIGPISNPILSKDPRSLTEARLLFIQDELPGDHALGGGNFQVYALQLRAALTDRLSFVADKDGIADTHFRAVGNNTGLLNMNFGLKYLVVRDVEDQILGSVGFTYEPPMGERDVFENHGDGVMTLFTAWGKELGCNWHVLNTFGYQFGLNSAQNSDFFYDSLHLDYGVAGWVYPLVELNWFHYTHGGHRGLPPALGEGDGLLNLGTSGVAGNDLVTIAAGVKARLSEHADTGVAYEVPISNRHDLLENRLLVELILRY